MQQQGIWPHLGVFLIAARLSPLGDIHLLGHPPLGLNFICRFRALDPCLLFLGSVKIGSWE